MGADAERWFGPGEAVFASSDTYPVTFQTAIYRTPRKIRVNALNPGGTETEGAHAAGVMGMESKKQVIASTPLGRLGQPEDVARVAVFLASDDAGWLTGELIFANGGNR